MENIFSETENGILQTDVDDFERDFKLSLPISLKEHLLKYNGGTPQRNFYLMGSRSFIIDRFYSLKYGDLKLEDAIDDFQITEQVIPKHLLPFAYDPFGNIYCISLAPKEHGKIYIWLHDVEGERVFVSDSLEEFIENTITHEEWQQRKQ
jgi:cell wall assembly regulator SMI1